MPSSKREDFIPSENKESTIPLLCKMSSLLGFLLFFYTDAHTDVACETLKHPSYHSIAS